jgi:thiamine transporter
MSFFVKTVEDSLQLTTAGYVALIILMAAAVIVAAILARKKQPGKQMGARQLAFCAMAIALGMVASMIKLYSFPFGGSVTMFSMLFICLPGYFYGPAAGILTAVAYGILQFIIEPYIYFPVQVLVDYVLAFGALGLSGFFANKKQGLLKGYLLGILGRYVFVVISGWIFFGEYAWEGWSPLTYSLAYNGAYIFTEAAITIVILLIPAVSRGLAEIKTQANV